METCYIFVFCEIYIFNPRMALIRAAHLHLHLSSSPTLYMDSQQLISILCRSIGCNDDVNFMIG